MPRYAIVPGLGDDKFADLEKCVTIEKSLLPEAAHTTGCPSDDDKKRFADAVARQRGRFAFPNGVDSTLGQMSSRLKNKAGGSGDEGRLLDDVIQVRARARNGWAAVPVELSLTFVIDPRSMPAGSDDEPTSPDLKIWVERPRGIADIATRLIRTGEPADRHHLWQLLAQNWADLCTGPGVTAVDGAAVSLTEYSLARAMLEPEVDLDHLTSYE